MKAADNTRRGLEEEHKLPDAFTAKTDLKTGTVQIARRGGGKVTIPMNSFASVANVLAELWPGEKPTLEARSTLKITDGFSNRSATITAGALKDVAAALEGLVTKKGKDLPSEEIQAPSRRKKAAGMTKPAAASKKAPTKASSSKKPAGKPAKAKADEAITAPAPAVKAAKAQAERPRAALPSPDSGPDMPSWLAALDDTYHRDYGEGISLDLVRARILLEEPKSRNVTGRAGAKDEPAAWGYEVISDGRHVAWVIAESERSFVITGVPDYEPSVHRVIPGLIARLSVSVLPRVLGHAA